METLSKEFCKSKKRILVTGASGFVAHHACEEILKKTDWDIVALCRDTYAGDIHRLYDIQSFKENMHRITVVWHDLNQPLSPDKVKRIGHVDYILHMAANSHVNRSITHPVQFFQDNVMGTVNILEYLRLSMPSARFINFSTDEVYGPAPEGYNYKETDRHRPSNPYSAAKSGQEQAGTAYHVTYGLDIITTNTMNIFGERQNNEKFVAMILDNVLNGREQIIHSKLEEGLETTRDKTKVVAIGSRFWLHARNAANACLFLLENGKAGETYNIVGDIELDNLAIAEKVAEFAGKELKPVFMDFHKQRPGHDRRYALDGTKLKSMGWVPPVTFEDSLRRTVEWTLTRGEQ